LGSLDLQLNPPSISSTNLSTPTNWEQLAFPCIRNCLAVTSLRWLKPKNAGGYTKLSMNTRNKPCDCGSGQKTKRCCQSPEALAYRAEKARAARMEEYRARKAQLQKEREEYRAKDPENGPFTYRHHHAGISAWIGAALAAAAIPRGRL